MKDIDFDELDKAVNSLMGTVKGQSDQPAPKTLTISTTLKDNESPEYTKLEKVAQKIGSETIGGPVEHTAILSPETTSGEEGTLRTLELTTPQQPAAVPEPSTPPPSAPRAAVTSPAPRLSRTSVAARPSQGRFMDVMHHSSDMKTSAPPQTMPSHEGMTITPPSPPSSITPIAPSSAPVAPPLSSPSSPPIPAVSVESPTTATIASPEPLPTPELVASAPQTPEPLSSPFLPDAKVEKRPLGGTAASSGEAASDTLDALGDMPPADTQLASNAAPVVEELPAELRSDVLSIETNLALDEQQPRLDSEQSVEPVAPVSEFKDSLSGPASIPQQYQELPSTSDQTSGAIFDVDDYHKQPAHPAKASRSWIWIVAIIVIIVVCAAGGAAFYLLSANSSL